MRNDHFFPQRGLQLGTAILCLLAVSVIGQDTNPPAVNVRAWGLDQNGQCRVPTNLTSAIAIAAGAHGSAAVLSDNTIMAWGWDCSSWLCSLPADITNAASIAAGGGHLLVLRSDGKVLAWGQNNDGQCDVPANLADVAAVAAGPYHSLALRADGTVLPWGAANPFGGDDYGQCDVPTDLTNAVAVAAGWGHSLALRSGGTVLAWGNNEYGQCEVPADLTNAVAVAAGSTLGLALKADGKVVAWGTNSWGECREPVPPDLTNVVTIAAGDSHCLALKADGAVVAWGNNNFGQCSVPSDLPRVTAISAGFGHSLVLVDPTTGAAPAIVMPPRTQTAGVGSSVHFSVRAVGFPPLGYQWYFGTNVITGATSALLTLSNLQPGQSGEYTVVVTNPAGSTTSPPAMLSVLPALEVHMVPGITLNGGVGLTYRLEFINAAGPTNAWEVLATLLITNQPQYYFDLSAIGQPRRFYRLVELP